MEKKTIAICVPIEKTVPSDFFLNYIGILLGSQKYEIKILFSNAFPISVARNELVLEALEKGFDYLLFLDTDMLFPNNIIDLLLNMKKDIASALYFSKNPPYRPIIRKKHGNSYAVVKQVDLNKIIEVDAVGFGSILIKRQVFEKIQEKEGLPFFQLMDARDIPVGEDVYFCEKAGKAGFKIFVNTGLICGHIGSIIVDEKLYYLQLQDDVQKGRAKIEKR